MIDIGILAILWAKVFDRCINCPTILFRTRDTDFGASSMKEIMLPIIQAHSLFPHKKAS